MPAHAADYVRKTFGTLPDGGTVEAVTLSGGGVDATVITYGATLQAVMIPDRTGKKADVTVGYDTLDAYLKTTNYFGSTVGRYANRIANGRFTLDGKTYQLPRNNGAHSLHGGTEGFDRRLWEIVSVARGPVAKLTLRLVSPDGDQGYPGTLDVTVGYAVDDQGMLSITHRATTDRPTVVNLTNHAYWNLAGDARPSGLGQRLTIPADHYLPTDAGLIPTGEYRPVAGTPFDFRSPKIIGDRVRDARDEQLRIARGYDHNWVVARTRVAEPRLVARLEDPQSGRIMDMLSTEPGLQFYSGNFLDSTLTGKGGQMVRQGDAVCLEPQMFPDTPNQPGFGSTRLDPGRTYEHRMILRFSTAR